MNSKTPIKISLVVCVICGCVPKEARNVHSIHCKDNFPKLLSQYGGINVQTGKMCRVCMNQLISLHKKATTFYEQCQSNYPKLIKGSKRMVASPSPIKGTYMSEKKISTPSGRRPIKSSRLPTPTKQTPLKESRRMLFAERPASAVQSEFADNFPFDFTDHMTVGMEIEVSQTTNCVVVEEDERRVSKQHAIQLKTYEAATNSCSSGEKEIAQINVEKTTEAHEHGYSKMSMKRTTYVTKTTQNISQPDDHDYLQSKTKPSKFTSLFEDMRTFLSSYDEKSIVRKLSTDNDVVAETLMGRKFNTSVLMEKAPSDLKMFTWGPVLEEFKLKFPDLFFQILTLLVKAENRKLNKAMETAVPRMGLIYGLIMQGRNRELSLVQRMNSAILFNSICDIKVYDRLQREGVCLGYQGSLNLLETIGGTFNHAVIDLVKQKQRFRLVGDNINWTVGVHDQRMDNRSKMYHAFGSAILVHNMDFSLCNTSQQRDYENTPVHEFIPAATDYKMYRYDYTVLMSRVAFKFLPYFNQFEDIVPSKISPQKHELLSKKTRVIPLPVLFENEQKYQDVVRILDYYETLICDANVKAGVPVDDVRIHIGGDQLTRERYSGAKRLRGHEDTPRNRFEHLSPITFELFHMHMNFLSMAYKILFNQKSGQDNGSMKCLQNIISRTNVGENINDHYDADKDFFISVVDVHIAELFMEYFDMDDTNSVPKRHVPPTFNTQDEKKQWYFSTIGDMADQFILHNDDKAQVDEQLFEMTLPNGKKLSVTRRPEIREEDGVLNYGKRVLELGLLFKDLLDTTKLPDRERHISLLKLAMLQFKSHRNLSKYAYEIMRLLVHQICTLSEKSANEEYYGLFVNTNGQADGHIPADRRMEYLVKENKLHIKHMYSNKTEKNIINRTSGISSIADISRRFDDATNVLKRTQRHSSKSAMGDEYALLQSIHTVRPYRRIDGRFHSEFRRIRPSALSSLNTESYRQWVNRKKEQFAHEIGN